MEGTGFLKTVRVGGFDKKDVLAYVDDLNTKIYTLEAELEEKKTLLESAGGGSVDTGKYDELLAADKAKISELMAGNDSLKLQMKSIEDEMNEKIKENDELKRQNSTLEEELREAKNKLATGAGVGDNSAMDLSNVFIEAQKTANSIVSQAKENARKMDEDAKRLANQVVDDANGKASTIVKSADDKANRILVEAEDKSSEMRSAAANIRNLIATEINDIETNVYKLNEVLQLFSNESLSKLSQTKSIIEKTQESLRKGNVPAADKGAKPASSTPKPAPAPQPAPETSASQPVKPASPAPPKLANKFGFDMSELESLTKAAEAAASGGSLEAGNIKLSDM